MKKLLEQGIGSQVHYIPVPMHPYYENLGMDISNYPETKSYYNEALTITIYYGLSDKQVNEVIDVVKEVINP
jgi:dTDP-4-amino-4,6-dideoxygalactose transaminase